MLHFTSIFITITKYVETRKCISSLSRIIPIPSQVLLQLKMEIGLMHIQMET